MVCSTVLVDPFDSLDSNPEQHMRLSKGEIMTGGGSGNGQTKMHELPNIYTQPSAHTSQQRENRCRMTCVHE